MKTLCCSWATDAFRRLDLVISRKPWRALGESRTVNYLVFWGRCENPGSPGVGYLYGVKLKALYERFALEKLKEKVSKTMTACRNRGIVGVSWRKS